MLSFLLTSMDLSTSSIVQWDLDVGKIWLCLSSCSRPPIHSALSTMTLVLDYILLLLFEGVHPCFFLELKLICSERDILTQITIASLLCWHFLHHLGLNWRRFLNLRCETLVVFVLTIFVVDDFWIIRDSTSSFTIPVWGKGRCHFLYVLWIILLIIKRFICFKFD